MAAPDARVATGRWGRGAAGDVTNQNKAINNESWFMHFNQG